MLFPHLNERQQRLALAAEARLLGHGGVRAVARAAGVSETTVRKGVFELEGGEGPLPDGRVRRDGGGRKNAEERGGRRHRLAAAVTSLARAAAAGSRAGPYSELTEFEPPVN